MYLDSVKKLIKSNKYYEDLYDIIWKLGENQKIKKENYNGVKIGLFNTPCAGFGDIIHRVPVLEILLFVRHFMII